MRVRVRNSQPTTDALHAINAEHQETITSDRYIRFPFVIAGFMYPGSLQVQQGFRSTLTPFVDEAQFLTRRHMHPRLDRQRDVMMDSWPAVPFRLSSNPSPSQRTFDEASLHFSPEDQALMFESHPHVDAPLALLCSEFIESHDTSLLLPLDNESSSWEKAISRMMLPITAGTMIADSLSHPSLASTSWYRNSSFQPRKTTNYPEVSFIESQAWNPSLATPISDLLLAEDTIADPAEQSSKQGNFVFIPSSEALLKDPEKQSGSQTSRETQTIAFFEAETQNCERPKDRPYECKRECCGLRFRKRCNLINHEKIVRKYSILGAQRRNCQIVALT
jgi:hypothetical protein